MGGGAVGVRRDHGTVAGHSPPVPTRHHLHTTGAQHQVPGGGVCVRGPCPQKPAVGGGSLPPPRLRMWLGILEQM